MRRLLTSLPLDLAPGHPDPAATLAAVLGGAPGDYREATLERLSLDARHKGALRQLATLAFRTDRDLSGAVLPPGCRLEPAPEPASFEVLAAPRRPRVVVVGTGPAGAFCTLRLLDYGIAPVVLERGPAMAERVQAVNRLWTAGELDPTANAQFGEGGAGTFSDGKLTTRIGHPATGYVLSTFVRFGADPRIAWLAKPHVGTDVIRGCSVRLRREAEARGAVYRWRSRLADLAFGPDGSVRAAVLEGGEEIPCDAVVLATGHSARDTFAMLADRGVALRARPFAMGVRIEHPQDLVDRAQYGPARGAPGLPPADYRLACNLGVGRAAWSFCMCPGGEVIQCASEPGGVVVNGMSNAARDSGFANSGLVAKVGPADYDGGDALAGVRFQRAWEQAAFRAAGERYGAPAMAVEDLLSGRASGRLPRSSFRPFAVPADLRTCLPEPVLEQLRAALPAFDRKVRGFASREALLLAPESRTSSPVQVLRGEDGQAPGHAGLYPCGEGAGFAGGITSAAVDGIRVAGWIARAAGAPVFQPFEKAVRGSELANEY